MKLTSTFYSKMNWLYAAIHFFKIHFLVIIGLGSVAAFGRVIQLGGFGPIQPWMNIVLETVIESARILLFVYVLGLASVKNGVLRIKRFFSAKGNRKLYWSIAVQKFKRQWAAILLNLGGFLLIAWCMNYLIDLLAYETCLYIQLKSEGILAGGSSEWTILLFFKNLSVIPFTLIFDALFLLWITNKFQDKVTPVLHKKN